MDSKCVYEDKAVIHELTQGLQMAQQLRDNLHSPKARDFYIQMILFSYDKALCIMRSGHSAGQLPESSISFASPRSKQFQFDQCFSGQQGENTISKKRKQSTTWKERHSKVHKCFATKQVNEKNGHPTGFDIAYNRGAQSTSPPPLSPEIYEITPIHHLLSPPSPGEMLSNLRANLSVNTSDLGGDIDTIPSLFSFPSTSSGLIQDNHQLHFPNYYDDELLPIFSPPFISPVTSESNMFSEWGSSQSLDFLADADLDFEFNNSMF
ncbi:uncharacterized protein LOC143585159 [Bidens hawaiensis]|uniref:uncharacterized protein LOC143585159 n=1 Tax=Bidens hawaiensis TaxID=980011 RepID=UPI0040492CE5